MISALYYGRSLLESPASASGDRGLAAGGQPAATAEFVGILDAGGESFTLCVRFLASVRSALALKPPGASTTLARGSVLEGRSAALSETAYHAYRYEQHVKKAREL